MRLTPWKPIQSALLCCLRYLIITLRKRPSVATSVASANGVVSRKSTYVTAGRRLCRGGGRESRDFLLATPLSARLTGEQAHRSCWVLYQRSNRVLWRQVSVAQGARLLTCRCGRHMSRPRVLRGPRGRTARSVRTSACYTRQPGDPLMLNSNGRSRALGQITNGARRSDSDRSHQLAPNLRMECMRSRGGT